MASNEAKIVQGKAIFDNLVPFEPLTIPELERIAHHDTEFGREIYKVENRRIKKRLRDISKALEYGLKAYNLETDGMVRLYMERIDRDDLRVGM